ncbi:MAG: hypothetical protein RBR84_06835 [Bacteroidales bacterium]|jgi:hypothetical protein|nr:hypothetical protein [Bacteroidales bacterium]MDD4087111.1 hypothetical protein [Bacteroidales bacterium]MDY0085616.1 hypothetical protein [Bacteroidales bacterium]
METEKTRDELFKTLIGKSTLKQDIYANTFAALRLFKSVIEELTKDYLVKFESMKTHRNIAFENRYRGDFEIELKFGGDILLFLMHTNVFEFNRDHDIMRSPYIREDRERSYCGIINIYNFLSDSFKYNRYNDIGYLIGRIFINKENHYFIEGKRELGLLLNNFSKNELNREAASTLIEAAITYTINFDLLTPPYETVKMVTVNEMKNTLDAISMKTGKRLGFQFQADVNGDELK